MASSSEIVIGMFLKVGQYVGKGTSLWQLEGSH